MPISRFTRNNLVYANNKAQNIEYRIFGSSGSLNLQNSQSLYLQNSGTYDLEYAKSIALSYNSYYNKLIADRSSQTSTLKSRYYNSQSKSNPDYGYIMYENSRSMYLQVVSNFFILEGVGVPTNTSASIGDTGSNQTLLRTRYYNSESKSTIAYLGYQNDRSVYLENTLNAFVTEYISTSSLLTDTGSNQTLLRTRYYNSESKSTITYLGYQNDRSVYLENTLNAFVTEYGVTSSLLTDTGSNQTLLRTRYYNSESKSTITYLGYQNDRAIYLENTLNAFVTESNPSYSVYTNDTGSNQYVLKTNYYISQSVSTPSTQIGDFGGRTIYLEDPTNFYSFEFGTTSSLLTDTGSNVLVLSTNYYNSESIATGSSVSYENLKFVYLEDTSYLLLEP